MTADEHSGCRIQEFARWNRVTLEHEREYLSKVMAGSAFIQPSEKFAVLHDITDIDFCLAELTC